MRDSIYRPLALVFLAAVGGVGAVGVKTLREQLDESRSAAAVAAAWHESAVAPVRWEYRTVTIHADVSNRREGDGAGAFGSVTPGDEALNVLGADGWELVTSYLEMETAWVNFGNSRYVTGLQPNVRPQRAVLLFRRVVRTPPAPPRAPAVPGTRT